MNQQTPNFFLLGAPKCGTTAMRNYLEDHPEVFFSVPEEPGYFDRNLRFVRESDMQFPTLTDYLKIYRASDPDVHKVTGEGSVYMMYSEEAVRSILEHFPESKFLVMLREPISAAISMHGENLKPLELGREPCDSFEEAWDNMAFRAGCEEISRVHPFRFRYDELFSYHKYLKTIVPLIEAGRIKFVVYEEFLADNQGVFADVCRFLSIDDKHVPDVKTFNSRSQARKNPISQMIFLVAKLARKYRFLNRFRGRGWTLNRFTQKDIEKPRISCALHDSMKHLYYKDIEELSDIVGKDLRALWERADD